jgi:hypothetical protein
MKNVALLALLMLAGCARRGDPEFRPEKMELWYWHHSYLVSPEAVRASEKRIDRAVRAGYTGVALWDSGLIFIGSPDWPPRNAAYMREVTRYATARGLRVMPVVAPYGHSNDALIANPNWAEGQRVIGQRFQVAADGKRLEQIKSLSKNVNAGPRPFLVLRLPVTPWRQYHVRFFRRTSGFHGLAQIEISDGADNRLDANLNPPPDGGWAPVDYAFNSGGSKAVKIAVGQFGPHTGELSIDRFFVEETALVYVLRRDGTPLSVYDGNHPSHAFGEGMDFDPIHDQKLLANPRFDHDNFHDPGPVTIPPGSHLLPRQVVTMDYYAVAPVYDEAVGMCLTDPGVERWMRDNARAAASLAPPRSNLMLSHDEMRHMNSCAACRAKDMTAGQLLAWSFQRTAKALGTLGPLYVWSDMFDPYQNARDRYYFVEGTVAGSWRGVPENVTIVNWNLERLTPSLTWFSGDDPRQPVAHRQVIAGFYDPADRDGAGAARREMARAAGIPGVVGMMYTTWTDDYSQLESYARGARQAWSAYRNSRP